MSEVKKRGRPKKVEIVNRTDVPDDEVNAIVKEKRHRNRPDLANFGQEYIEPGDNTRFITFAMQFRKLPKPNFDNNAEVQERIEYYFTRCAEEDMKPGVVGLANALHVDRNTLGSWKRGERRADQPGFQEMIKEAFSFIENMWEQYMQNGKISPPNGIFLGKNHFGYVDVQEVVVQPQNPYNSENPNNVRDKYIEGVRDEIHADGSVE